nr:hypothetical protein [Tanacetum cinerariifolium]
MKFFLGLQIHQSPCGIFINQAKYTLKILHKHGMDKGQSIGTPMATKPKLDADFSGNPVDQTDYRSKIGSLMYLTSSRQDIVQAICFCARYQSRPTEKHLKENCTAMSSAEAEYVTLSVSCAQVMWMRIQLQDYGFNFNKIPLYCDSHVRELLTILEKESNEFIKSSVEDLVPIPCESGDTSGNDSLEDIKCKDSYDPNLDESTFLVTPLFDSNEDEYFTPGDDVKLLLQHDPSIPKISVAFILEGFTNEPPLEENDDLFDLEPKNDDWKKILYDAPILKTMDKVFDTGICVKKFSPTYDCLDFEDSRAHGFVHRPLELQSFTYGNPIS